MYEVRNTEMSDLQEVFDLFAYSIAYQEKKGYPVWRDYDKGAIVNDIENKNQYKVIIDGKTSIAFSVCYADKLIWRHMDKGDSVYLHRIVVNPEFKGQKLFGKILEWAIGHSKEKGLSTIRMDTWASNPTIINYYKTFGFDFIENYITPDSHELPVHNRNLALALLEYKPVWRRTNLN
jgi:ribosomal protein S18 acetylase RimI-like enzyme